MTDFIHKKLDDEEMKKIAGTKHFNICLMNPPYSKGLHYKFIDKCNKIAKCVISIQPAQWLFDPTAKYEEKSQFVKLNNSVIKRLNDLEIIKKDEAEKIFKAAFVSDVGIFVCNDEGGYDIDKISSDSIVDKVLKYMPTNISSVLEFDEPKKCIILSRIIGGNGGRSNFNLNVYGDNYKSVIFDENGKRLDNGLTFYENRKKTAWGNVKPKKEQLNIKFNTIDECINFFNYTKTYVFRYMINKTVLGMELNRTVLPFMKDYTKPWTDKRLYEFFKLTDDEINHIENYIDDKLKELKKFNIEQESQKKRSKNK